jgi:hypothetical protein
MQVFESEQSEVERAEFMAMCEREKAEAETEFDPNGMLHFFASQPTRIFPLTCLRRSMMAIQSEMTMREAMLPKAELDPDQPKPPYKVYKVFHEVYSSQCTPPA